MIAKRKKLIPLLQVVLAGSICGARCVVWIIFCQQVEP